MKPTYDIVDLGMLVMEDYMSCIKMHTWEHLIMNHLQHVNLALWVNYPNLHSLGLDILELIYSDVCSPMPV